MAHEQLRSSTIVRALADVVGDFTDAPAKGGSARAGGTFSQYFGKTAWRIVDGYAAGLTGLALLLCLQALVFGLASYGVALHWSFLIVPAASAILAALAFFIGRADADRSVLPQRTIHQLQQDVVLSKEQLT